MDLGLKGRTALVLGAGGGLGSVIAATLAAEGANVALADMDAQALAVTAQTIRSHGGRAIQQVWDLSDVSSIDVRIRAIEDEFGAIDVLINNTGGPPPTPAAGQSAELWAKSFQAMVLSVIQISDRVLPSMRERRWGRIVTSTSSGVLSPIPNLGISNALRLTLVGWSKTLAREIAPDGVTANIVVPGRIATARIAFLDQAKAKREGRTVAEVSAESTGSIPMRRYGTPQEYANAVAFLASDAASYITGSVVRVDGGLIASI
ncbi:SDR family oxidoreductase [Variovorax sp. 770b2]|uniref:SDR family oxidoreductase n=1 Tax=Variovorax sp. 770b2 TaxID=1566271 RepID=UPI0008E57560|nr:SDR family oxidoreductase [Variovorax sp. 770b2]SFQ33558.1 3-oxoacyl-[acyl-carrier protein] reductase [Variovorax sp. 770b2]